MVIYKLNTFHWHLSDDQGRRVEIKKYPMLTSVGSTRVEFDGSENSGYSTQAGIKEVVEYAHLRFISIIPEIELPGHALAALAAYPEYSCTGGPFKVQNLWGVESDVYCAGNDAMFKFAEDIIDEITTLFPYKYIHISSDECPKERWKDCPKCQNRIKTEGFKDENELQSYFIKRIEKILQKKGKKLVGWDEILEGGLAPSATIISWRGKEGGIAGVKQNHDVIMTPNNRTYLNYYQGSDKVEPTQIKGLVTLKDVYEYNPIPKELSAEKNHYIIGTQGCAWMEYIDTEEGFNYQVYPRLIALAEVGWTITENKNFDDFLNRLDNQYTSLELKRISYHVPIPEGSISNLAFTESVHLDFTTTRPINMYYTLDGTEPSTSSYVYRSPIILKNSNTVKFRSQLSSGKLSLVRTIVVGKQSLVKAEDVTSQLGVKLKQKFGVFLNVSQIEDNSFWNDRVVSSINLKFDYKKPSAAIFQGYINVPDDGVYIFSTDMDQLFIADKLVVNTDGAIKKNSRNDGSIALMKGKLKFLLIFSNNTIGEYTSAKNEIKILFKKADQPNFSEVSSAMLSY